MKVKDTELGESITDMYQNASKAAASAALNWQIFTALVIGSTLWWAYKRDKRRGYL